MRKQFRFKFERRSEDAAWRYQSLDDLYYYGGQSYWGWTVTEDHNPPAGDNSGEQVGRKGDEAKVLGNHWNGYSKVIIIIAQITMAHL